MSLEKLLAGRIKGKTSIIGVGNRLRGDDGLGLCIVDALTGKVSAALLDAGEVPESYLGRIIKESPSTIIVIDAVNMGTAPGSIAVLESGELSGKVFSTHRLSLGLFFDYLKRETGADVFLIGVQPAKMEFGQELSPEIQKSVDCLAGMLVSVLNFD